MFLLIGTTGEIMPASLIPHEAAKNHASIIEINIEPSNYTHSITNIFIKSKATQAMQKIADFLLIP